MSEPVTTKAPGRRRMYLLVRMLCEGGVMIALALVLGGAARFVVHYISGITIYKILAPTEIFGTVFDNPALYSLIYNGSYVGIDLVLCLVIFGILYAPLKKYMMGADLRR